jgi:NADPH2:quinone reductase
MRIAWYDEPGPADQVLRIGEIEKPSPGPGEVLIHMQASGVNPADVRRRAGWTPSDYGRFSKRVVPHTDGAGVVESLGEGVDARWLGRRVWVWNAGGASFYGFPEFGADVGAAAEYIALPVRFVADLPEAAAYDAGACLGGPACTAHFVIFADGPVDGATILVQGGTGAVGELAVQFAAHAGATVIAVVSSDEKAERAMAAGARHVVNRARENVAESVLAACPAGVDRLIEVEFGLNIETDARLIKPNGTIVSYSSPSAPRPTLPYYALQRKGVTLRLVQAYILPEPHRSRAISEINAHLSDGRLVPTIAKRFPLEEIAAAHALLESGKASGNVIVTT